MPRRARVLAVDDDREVLDTLTEFLTVLDYEVVTALSAGDALALVKTAPPDVVLLDFSMPGTDGITALGEMRAIDPDLPVIMLTANADPAVLRHTLKHGAFHYVAKPFDFDGLADTIAAAVESRRAAGRAPLG